MDKLAAKELVIRERDDLDRRAYRIHLTPKGRELEAAAVAAARVTLQKALAGISPEEAEVVLRVMDAIYQNLE